MDHNAWIYSALSSLRIQEFYYLINPQSCQSTDQSQQAILGWLPAGSLAIHRLRFLALLLCTHPAPPHTPFWIRLWLPPDGHSWRVLILVSLFGPSPLATRPIFTSHGCVLAPRSEATMDS